MNRRTLIAIVLAVVAATVAAALATRSDAGQRFVPSATPEMSVFANGSPAAVPADVAHVAKLIPGRADLTKARVLANGAGKYGSRLIAFPSDDGANVCYALVGRSERDPGMSYCYQPKAPDAPSPLAGQHFHAVALYSATDGDPRVQLFGIAFDDVTSMRVDVAGSWRGVPLRRNGFYLDLAGVQHEQVGVVEATLADGAVQRHDIQQGG